MLLTNNKCFDTWVILDLKNNINESDKNSNKNCKELKITSRKLKAKSC